MREAASNNEITGVTTATGRCLENVSLEMDNGGRIHVTGVMCAVRSRNDHLFLFGQIVTSVVRFYCN